MLDAEHLAELIDSLPRKQRTLGTVLLERPEVFAFGTLSTIERLLQISRITVIRFSKRLGFRGFQGLQAAVRDSFLRRSGFRLPATRSSRAASPDQSVAATIEQHRANFGAVVDGIDLAALEGVAHTIEGASRVLVCGNGAAAVVAQLFVRFLRHVGLRGEYIELAGADEVLGLYDVGSEDVVVAVAFWLSFSPTLRALRLAGRQGAQTVAIVGRPTSPLASEAGVTLHAPAQGAVLPFSSVGAVALVECLAAAIAGRSAGRVETIRDELHRLYVEEGLIAAMAPSEQM